MTCKRMEFEIIFKREIYIGACIACMRLVVLCGGNFGGLEREAWKGVLGGGWENMVYERVTKQIVQYIATRSNILKVYIKFNKPIQSQV